jgi:hypothetical protein
MNTEEYKQYLNKVINQLPDINDDRKLGYWLSCVIMRDYIMPVLN